MSKRTSINGMETYWILNDMKRAERFRELQEEIFISFIEEKKERVRCFFRYFPDLPVQRPDKVHYKLAEISTGTGENGEDYKERVAQRLMRSCPVKLEELDH